MKSANEQKQRQKMLLGILGVAVLLAVWMNWPSGGDEGPPAGTNAPSGGVASTPYTDGPARLPGARRPPRSRASTVPTDRVLPLQMAALQRAPRDYKAGRDPWRFVEPPPPPPPPPPPAPRGPSPEELARIREEQERLARLRAEEIARAQAEAARPKPPPFTLKYLGNMGHPTLRIAVFADDKGNIYNVLEGQEIIPGQFILASIGYESAEIKFVNFPDWPAQRVAVGPR